MIPHHLRFQKTKLFDIDSYMIVPPPAPPNQKKKTSTTQRRQINRVNQSLVITDAPNGKQAHRVDNVKPKQCSHAYQLTRIKNGGVEKFEVPTHEPSTHEVYIANTS